MSWQREGRTSNRSLSLSSSSFYSSCSFLYSLQDDFTNDSAFDIQTISKVNSYSSILIFNFRSIFSPNHFFFLFKGDCSPTTHSSSRHSRSSSKCTNHLVTRSEIKNASHEGSKVRTDGYGLSTSTFERNGND